MAIKEATQYEWYWISIVILLGYYSFDWAYWIYQREKIMDDRGQKEIANIINLYTRRNNDDGTTNYYVQYQFSFNNRKYNNNALISHIEYTGYVTMIQHKMESGLVIDIIFDPQNPSYNEPYSQYQYAESTYCTAYCIAILGIVWILGIGITFGIAIKFKWYNILITTFVIPSILYLIIRLFVKLCTCCKSKKKRRNLQSRITPAADLLGD